MLAKRTLSKTVLRNRSPREAELIAARLERLEEQLAHAILGPSEEHALVQQVLAALDRLPPDDPRWANKLKLLGMAVEEESTGDPTGDHTLEAR